jgi:hypothetical protein
MSTDEHSNPITAAQISTRLNLQHSTQLSPFAQTVMLALLSL